MKLLFRIFLVFTCSLQLANHVQAQQNLVYSHYFINPFLYNPSFVAPNGYAELYLNYRNQWAGIEGAPTTGTVSVHLPLSYKAGLAFTGYQDKAGVLKTTTGLLTFAYQVHLGNRLSDNHKIGFGISAGMMSSSIEPDDANDPVAGTTSSFEGQFGLHYQLNNLKIAFAIPRLFRTYVASDQDFNKLGVEQIRTTITSVSYNIKLGNRFTFEPIATYRSYENTTGQFEGMGVVRMDNIVWAGGSYRQDYGATAFVGFNVKDKLKLGYAYEFAVDQINAFGDGTHELQLVVRFGKKKNRKPQSKNEGKLDQQTVAENINEEVQVEKEVHVKEEAANEEVAVSEILPSTVVSKSEQPSIPSVANQSQMQAVKSLSGNGLPPGHYVVVGAFRSVENAKSYSRTLKRSGYRADVAYYPEKNYYIVHTTNASTLEEAQELRNKYKQMSRYSFRDTWILSVE